jgi:uncharacterized protein with PIN domain
MNRLDRETLSRIAVATYLDPNSTLDLIDNAPVVTLPVYKLSDCPFDCPRCAETMRSDIANNVPYVGKYGVFRLNSAPIYRCTTCEWEYTPHEAFELVEQTILRTIEKEKEKNDGI